MLYSLNLAIKYQQKRKRKKSVISLAIQCVKLIMFSPASALIMHELGFCFSHYEIELAQRSDLV